MSERLDDNLFIDEVDGVRYVVCAHCQHKISRNLTGYLADMARQDGPSSMAGPKVCADASTYLDTTVSFRQYYCPDCFTAVLTQVVPDSHPQLVMTRLSEPA
jgi:N-methylhydantoinase B